MIYPQSLANSEPMMQMPQRCREGGGNCHAIPWLQHSPDDAARAHMPPIRKGSYTTLPAPSPPPAVMALPHYWQPATETAAAVAAIGVPCPWRWRWRRWQWRRITVHNALKRAKNFRFSEHNILRFHGSLPHAGKWKIHCHTHTHAHSILTHTYTHIGMWKRYSRLFVFWKIAWKSFEALGRQAGSKSSQKWMKSNALRWQQQRGERGGDWGGDEEC